MISADGSSLLCVEFYGDHVDELIGPDGGGRARSRSSARPRRVRQVARSGGAAGDLELPRSGARAVDGDEDATTRRSRSSKTPRSRRRSCATTSSGSSASCSATTPRPAFTRTRRSAACTCGRWSTSRPPRASRSSRRSPTRSPTWCWNSAARCRASTATAWCAARSTRRCSARSSTRRSAQVKRTFDPQRPVQSRPHRRHAADHLAPALRRRLRDAVAGDVLRLLAITTASAARSRCAAASGCAARSARARCARRTW